MSHSSKANLILYFCATTMQCLNLKLNWPSSHLRDAFLKMAGERWNVIEGLRRSHFKIKKDIISEFWDLHSSLVLSLFWYSCVLSLLQTNRHSFDDPWVSMGLLRHTCLVYLCRLLLIDLIKSKYKIRFNIFDIFLYIKCWWISW